MRLKMPVGQNQRSREPKKRFHHGDNHRSKGDPAGLTIPFIRQEMIL
jgi:hypothetical protein